MKGTLPSDKPTKVKNLKTKKKKDKERGRQEIDEKHLETATSKWYASTSMFIAKWFFKSCRYFVQHTGRIIEAVFKTNTSVDLVVINNYTPHGLRSAEERFKHFEKLKEVTEENEGKIVFVIGDFNCRFHARTTSETDTIGPSIYGKGKEVMEIILERDVEGTLNRTLTM